jgi:hypothetical protein
LERASEQRRWRGQLGEGRRGMADPDSQQDRKKRLHPTPPNSRSGLEHINANASVAM